MPLLALLKSQLRLISAHSLSLCQYSRPIHLCPIAFSSKPNLAVVPGPPSRHIAILPIALSICLHNLQLTPSSLPATPIWHWWFSPPPLHPTTGIIMPGAFSSADSDSGTTANATASDGNSAPCFLERQLLLAQALTRALTLRVIDALLVFVSALVWLAALPDLLLTKFWQTVAQPFRAVNWV